MDFFTKDGKKRPINGSKGGVSEKDLNISQKGNNDTIVVEPSKTKSMKGNRESDIKEIPPSRMNLGGQWVDVPFDEKAWQESLKIARENKAWAEKTKDNKEWNKMASDMSKEMLSKYLTKPVNQLAIEHYEYWYMRSHSPVRTYGQLHPIDPEWAEKWEKITGKQIREEDYIVLPQ